MFTAILQFIKRLFFFTGYFENSSYPKPLSPADEKQCLAALKNGDADAREKLICHNMRLVAHIAKKYSNSCDVDDLISIGSIGLIKGIESYSNGKGTTLATYLARCIENEMLMTLRSNKRYKNTVYLQEQLGVDGDGNEYTLMEILPAKEDSVFRKAELNILRENLLKIIDKTLTTREKDIILMRFGLNGSTPLTQLETAKKLNISRSYISRIETRALKKIRSVMSDDDV
ncbi:MAG: RNA polymerase sporulation sigma factor SigK [Corallococcus sp.]|nr:RNA polymerase sporulation sigma factor SigK [Corallococcus sp.]